MDFIVGRGLAPAAKKVYVNKMAGASPRPTVNIQYAWYDHCFFALNTFLSIKLSQNPKKILSPYCKGDFFMLYYMQ
jgi:hypothetical protein